jgi:hypothetical protein
MYIICLCFGIVLVNNIAPYVLNILTKCDTLIELNHQQTSRMLYENWKIILSVATTIILFRRSVSEYSTEFKLNYSYILRKCAASLDASCTNLNILIRLKNYLRQARMPVLSVNHH